MTVYFLTEIREHYVEPMSIKIGRSRNLIRRMRDLQTGNPLKLTLMGEVRTQDISEDRQVEAALHRQFKSKRNRGEWFSIYPEDVIDGLKAHSPSAFIVVGTDPFEIVSYDRDAIPEFASPWEWGDVNRRVKWVHVAA